MTSRRRRKVFFGALAIGMITSALVAIALFYMSQTRPPH